MKLYHGTSSRHLAKILTEGLTPRNQNQISNWEHTVESGEDTVYLTNAYALYFANQACEDEHDEYLAILEIDTDFLDENFFAADEDAVEQTSRGKDDLPPKWTVHQRTVYYRALARDYRWDQSLQALGTCGYQEIIPVEAIQRIALISLKKYAQLVWAGYDPVISVMNYGLLGHQYRWASQWIFDADAQQEVDENNPFSAIMTMKLPEDRSGIEVLPLNQAKERFC
jgi:hypothetical protein